MEYQQKVAQALLKIGAVKFKLNDPITFKSGIVSPVYVDNRQLPFHPTEWKIVIDGFKDVIATENISYDVIAGVEAGGIPHSAALGFYFNMPSVFVRKHVKEHGTKNMIEGGNVSGKKVLLIEDLVSTGGSSLKGIHTLREGGAVANDCLVIVSYDFEESQKAFQDAQVKLHPLTSFPVILEEAIKTNVLSANDAHKIKEWFENPHKYVSFNEIIK